MADELIDVVDENNNLTGEKVMKSVAHRDGIWHRASHIWIYNSKGELLLQLRAKEKDLHPDKWDISAAGHVSSGEDPSISAIREMEEEIGLKVLEKDLELFEIKKYSGTFRDIVNNEYNYVYLYKFDGDINELKLQVEEVQEIKFISIERIEKELVENSNKYVPHGDYWNEIIEEVKRKLNKPMKT